ncbi:hypothetical protein M9H77_23421 [Catharanthus roseus]|uniref:Uncharacterized protein n=1 Tax=Catharanthus roseus TaxID=4058 RepID=A0ACC0AW65_CATRO|nr:hypothetical protein M9H77_23421 [Catharanthus roseus]
MVETLKPSMIEEFSKVNKLPQVQEVVEESIKIHVVEETSNEDSCFNMNEKSIEKEESIKIKKRGRVENKERLVERSCIFVSISNISKESEHFECSKEKESELEERIEEKGRRTEKELKTILEELPISLSLNPSLMCYEVSLVGLELFLESYPFHVSIYGDLCVISSGGALFLVVFYASTCLSSYAFLEDSLLHSGSMFELSCHDFRVMNNVSIESTVVRFGLDDALFDILQDKYLVKFVENIVYVSSFLNTFMENHNNFVSLIQLMSFLQKNSCAFILKHEFEDTLFIHLIFKEFFDRVVFKEQCRPFWNFKSFKSTFRHLLCEMMNAETHQGYSSMSNSIVNIIEECKVVSPKEELDRLYHLRGTEHQSDFVIAIDPRGWDWGHFGHKRFPSHPKSKLDGSNLDVKRSKFCEVLDLLPKVGPTSTVVGRLPAELDCEHNTVSRPVGCTLPLPVAFRKEMTLVIFRRDFIV